MKCPNKAIKQDKVYSAKNSRLRSIVGNHSSRGLRELSHDIHHQEQSTMDSVCLLRAQLTFSAPLKKKCLDYFVYVCEGFAGM